MVSTAGDVFHSSGVSWAGFKEQWRLVFGVYLENNRKSAASFETMQGVMLMLEYQQSEQSWMELPADRRERERAAAKTVLVLDRVTTRTALLGSLFLGILIHFLSKHLSGHLTGQ